MLDPREVRVGNWVLKNTGRDVNGRPYFEYKAIAPDEYYSTFARACFPILLSPDILGKSGFRHEFGDWYMNRVAEGIDEGLPFLRWKHTDKYWYLHEIKLEAQPLHLHQLQNLVYALSNKELNVQLGSFANNAMIDPIDFFVKPLNKTSLTNNTLSFTNERLEPIDL